MRLRCFLYTALCSGVLSSVALAQQATPAASTKSDKPATPRTGVQLRVESVGTHTKVGDEPTATTQNFQISTARLLASGELSDTVSYQLRLSLRSASGFSTERSSGPDGTLAALDRAWVEHRVAPGLAVRMGRLPIASGSIENDYSSIDVYYYSYQSNLVNRFFPTTTGVDVSYSMGKHTLSLQAFNGFYEGTVDKKGPQHGENISTAVAYRGSIAGGMVRPIVTYDRYSRVRNGKGVERDDKVFYTQIGAGAAVSVAGVDFELEYDTLTKPAFSSYNVDAATKVATKTDNKEVKVATIIGQVAYPIAAINLRPFVKMSNDVEDTDGKDSYKAQRGAIGTEWKPSTAKALRYHAVVVDMKDDAYKYDAAGTSTKTRTHTQQYLVGLVAKM